MKQKILTVSANTGLAEGIFEMKLTGVKGMNILPGSFVNLRIRNLFLRRPISVCFQEEDELTILFRAVGKGTEALSRCKPGEKIDALLELGNGYDLSRAKENPLLVGGGIGIPPLYYLARELKKQGKEVTAVLGFNRKEEIFYIKEFESCANVIVTTADGSAGIHGYVTDAIPEAYSFFYACGPLPMEKALNRILKGDGQFSLEERMGCGFGACMGCSVETRSGKKRICREGPVFDRGDLLWN